MSVSTPNERAAVSWFEVDSELAGQRIDNFLLNKLKGVPKSHVYRLLRTGQVRVNKGRVKPHYRLIAGDRVRVPPLRRGAVSVPAGAGKQAQDALEAAILYEDSALLVLNKPSGWAVHGGSGLSYGVIEALRAARPKAHYLELVHRLDRDTSGCLIVAKKRSALRALHEMLRAGAVEKRYWCLARGRWEGGRRRVRAALAKNQLQSGERMVRVTETGKQAATEFAPLEQFAGAVLLEAVLLTGRTHQIRVHAAHSGHPLAGDVKYGDVVFNAALRHQGLRRLFLHARSLRFEHPDGGRVISVSAPLDDQLQAVLARLRTAEEAAPSAETLE